MANQAEVELAKSLLSHRVVEEADLRRAFLLQKAQLEKYGKHVGLDRVLYHLKLIPDGGLIGWKGDSPLETQPFEGYELNGNLGEGGSSKVYSATYLENGASAAVKVLDPVQALRPDFLERFKKEAQLLIELEHENLIMGYEVGEAAGLHFFSMEAVEGDTLYEVIERRGFVSNEEALSIALQTARGLGYLHAQGYLHRDVKPSNIMVEASGRAVMIDLGLIRNMSEGIGDDESETMTVGTVEYLSPEQARGRPDLDPRSDIYSLGVSLYHMVVGDVPFKGENDYEVMAKQVLSDMDAQKIKQRRISPEAQFFITKMMSKDRNHRYEVVSEVIAELEGYVPTLAPIDMGQQPDEPTNPPTSTGTKSSGTKSSGPKSSGSNSSGPRSTGQRAPVRTRKRSSGELPSAPKRRRRR